MKNLIIFFNRNKFLLFFVSLQILCFILIFNNNNFQRRAIFNASNFVSGFIYESKTNVTDYFELKKLNQKLSDENALLRTILHSENKDKFGHVFEVNDSNYQINYEFIPSKVIDYTFNRKNNYLTLNIGSNQGVTKEMGVISENSVIGRIKEISPNYSVAYSILHEDFVLPIKHKNTNQFGLLKNSSKGINISSINEFPNHVKINEGDSIITRGGKGIFPEGLLVGIVSKIDEITGSSFYDISVELSTDMTNLNQSYVILSFEKQEIDSLTLKAIND